MKSYVEVIKDSFVDYAGKTHHFIIAAISDNLEKTYGDTPIVVVPQGLCSETIGFAEKGIRIGISICNPEDKFDEKVGTLKAIARAKRSNIALYASDKGYINTALVRAFLQQEAEYLKNNPEQYITGYEDSKSRYLKRKSMEEMKENFSSTEKIIVEEVQKNPKFLDNVNIYLTWLNNQKNGCKKSGK